MHATIAECILWLILLDRHWAGPAMWNVSIVLSLCAVLTGAQQTLFLATSEPVDQLNSLQLLDLKRSLSGCDDDMLGVESCPIVIFSW